MLINSDVYRLLVENHPEVVLIIDTSNSQIVHANQAALNFYGYTLNEFKAMKIANLNSRSEEEIREDIEFGRKYNGHEFVCNHILKDGTLKKVTVNAHKISIDNENVMLATITEHKESESQYNQEFLLMIKKMDDAVCLIKEDTNNDVIMIKTSDVFDELISSETGSVENTSFYTLANLNEGYTLNDNIIEGFLRNSLRNDWTPVRINSIKLRFEGEHFYLLTFKPKNFHARNTGVLNYKDFIDFEIDSLEKGYLINIGLFLNINQEDRFIKAQSNLVSHLKELFKIYNIGLKLAIINENIILFSNQNLSELYACLNVLIEKNNIYDNLEHFECKIRVSISEYAPFGKKQIESVNEVIDSFVPYEYNVIHTYNNKEKYFKLQEIKSSINQAIYNNDLELYAQGIIDISNNCIEGYEILLRWNHPKFGLIMPDEFIPYAEMTGKIIDIDFWVIEATFEFLRTHTEELSDLIIHVNLSTKTLASRDFIPFIYEKMNGIIPANIVFEITEDQSTSMMDFAISELRSLGFLLAIDDFGKGYSSFERIKNIGIQYVKIDKSFISGLTENVDDVLILKAIIGMCNNLNIKVIAEGIEKIEQLEFLYSRKCYFIQGFIFSKPKDIKTIIKEHHQLNKHVDLMVSKLLSNEVVSKKFYNSGRIILQDIDESFKFITPNVALAEALDYEFNDFIELSMLDIIPAQYVKTFKQFIESVNSDQDFDAIMVQLLKKDRQPCKVICAVSKKEKSRSYRLYIEILEKVNEREVELLGLSHSYLQAFDEAPSGMIIVNDNYSIKKWNISCESIFAHGYRDVKNQNIIKLLTNGEQCKEMNQLFNKAINQGNIEMVIENTKGTGETIICRWHINAIYDELEQSHQYICIVNDITEGIKKSRELSRVNKALDQSESIIIMTDKDGIIEYTNKQFYDVTGFTNEDALGQNLNMLSSGKKSSEYYAELWQTLLKGEIWEGELHNKRKNGEFYWAKTNIYPIIDGDEITGFVGIQTDTTTEKELLSLNLNLKNKLFEQDKVASLGLLSSGIMHEINNPLSYIQGNVKYIIEQFDDIQNMNEEDWDDIKDAILDVDKGVTQIKDIAEGLKKYIFKGEIEEKEDVNLVEEINTVLMLAKNEYKYHATVNFKYLEDHSYRVIGYASKLKQVFMNLIINAAHAIASMDKDGLGNIVIELIASEQDILITLTDDGCGMNLGTIEKIYEPLFTTKEEGVGSGLGLSVSRQIIEEEHGGVIVCESSVGNGTTFKIKLRKGL
jgi:PAS domain S-box-containing protein